MMNGKKKNLTILGIAILNLILTFFAVLNLKNMIPINIFEDSIGKNGIKATSFYFASISISNKCFSSYI